MKKAEFEALGNVERTHWFYRGKRELVRFWIKKSLRVVGQSDIILDAGAGTGELVRELRNLYGATGPKILGVEFSEEARSYAAEHNDLQLIAGSILEIPYVDGTATVSCALDVLEHVEDDKKALSELIRVTKPGGLIIINVPAFMLLWSDWDVSLGHYRRYSMSSMKALLAEPLARHEIEIVDLKFINSFAFPLILGYRLFRKLIPSDSRAEDSIPPNPINNLLYSFLVAPARWKWFRLPFGVSIFGVFRRK